MVRSDATMVILARGGSKGIPGKNLRTISDRSLLQWSVEAAIGSETIGRIIVSSDCPTIIEEAVRLGAETHRRSSVNSGDDSTSEEALLEVLTAFNLKQGMCLLRQCTTPFVSADDLSNGVELLSNNQGATVVSGYVESPHHWFWPPDKLEISPLLNSHMLRYPRQQESNRVFVENGGFYGFYIETFLELKNRFGPRVIPVEMPKSKSVDIDYNMDLIIAELVARNLELESEDSN